MDTVTRAQDAVGALAPPTGPVLRAGDPGQEFVSRLRSAAAGFAVAAGAQSAVVREAVPPARHRRSRCRVVLRYPDGEESDMTFLGPVSRKAEVVPSWFHATIAQWLETGEGIDGLTAGDGAPEPAPRWLVADDESATGLAVDVTAWLLHG